MKKRVRLTEGDLNRIVSKSIRRILNEGYEKDWLDKHQHTGPYIRPTEPFGVNRYILDKLVEVEGYLEKIAKIDGYQEWERKNANICGVPHFLMAHALEILDDVISQIASGNVAMK